MLYGPKGSMCCECVKWADCMTAFTPDFSKMKVIMVHKKDNFIEVRCDHYEKEIK